MSGTLRILVDDTDPEVHYSGQWSSSTSTFLNVGSLGLPFRNTLHGALQSASLMYTFSGTQVRIDGAYQGSGSNQPWECFVDGQKIPNSSNLGWGPLMALCESGSLSDGEHTVQLAVQDSTEPTVWFDAVWYTPSPNVSPLGKVVSLESTDPQVVYSQGWWDDGGISNSTHDFNSSLSISFAGTSLTWIASVIPGHPFTPGPCTYSINGGHPHPFTSLPPLDPAAQPPLWNQILFKTPTLPAGLHTITATFLGDLGQTPLNLDRVLIEGPGDNPSVPPPGIDSATSRQTTSTLTLSPPPSEQTPSTPPSHTLMVSSTPQTSSPLPTQTSASRVSNTVFPRWGLIAVAGGSGGLVLLLLGVLVFLFRRRCKTSSSEPTLGAVQPYIGDPSRHAIRESLRQEKATAARPSKGSFHPSRSNDALVYTTPNTSQHALHQPQGTPRTSMCSVLGRIVGGGLHPHRCGTQIGLVTPPLEASVEGMDAVGLAQISLEESPNHPHTRQPGCLCQHPVVSSITDVPPRYTRS